ncbi:hypothetical protein NK718_21190 [Alsobacter sp. SYSU M60028]|uniref:Uncharacterized protein n=1 Tax=Alsobacter ponti TaxID=2962936 RepID=A0ABT1LJY2_9HYPH|nr:hypothetical protein [Alsobacter ponti]MCP8941045.1 hypothetical protein [Alsobacter ponti]
MWRGAIGPVGQWRHWRRYLTGNNAGFTLNGGGVIDLTAPISGDQKGILIMQDPTSNPGYDNTLNGDAKMKLLGAIYTPTQSITVTGNSGFGQTSAFMPLVADTLKFSGNSTLNLDTTVMKPSGDLPRVENGARLIN